MLAFRIAVGQDCSRGGDISLHEHILLGASAVPDASSNLAIHISSFCSNRILVGRNQRIQLKSHMHTICPRCIVNLGNPKNIVVCHVRFVSKRPVTSNPHVLEIERGVNRCHEKV
jgi:hypothetical protein